MTTMEAVRLQADPAPCRKLSCGARRSVHGPANASPAQSRHQEADGGGQGRRRDDRGRDLGRFRPGRGTNAARRCLAVSRLRPLSHSGTSHSGEAEAVPVGLQLPASARIVYQPPRRGRIISPWTILSVSRWCRLSQPLPQATAYAEAIGADAAAAEFLASLPWPSSPPAERVATVLGGPERGRPSLPWPSTTCSTPARHRRTPHRGHRRPEFDASAWSSAEVALILAGDAPLADAAKASPRQVPESPAQPASRPTMCWCRSTAAKPPSAISRTPSPSAIRRLRRTPIAPHVNARH